MSPSSVSAVAEADRKLEATEQAYREKAAAEKREQERALAEAKREAKLAEAIAEAKADAEADKIIREAKADDAEAAREAQAWWDAAMAAWYGPPVNSAPALVYAPTDDT